MNPIETAPKDGTELLLLINNKWVIGYWHTDNYEPFKQYWMATLLPYHGCGCCSEDIKQEEVTHWLLLPETKCKR